MMLPLKTTVPYNIGKFLRYKFLRMLHFKSFHENVFEDVLLYQVPLQNFRVVKFSRL